MALLPLGIAALTLINAAILAINFFHTRRHKKRTPHEFSCKLTGRNGDSFDGTGLKDYMNLLEKADGSSRINMMDADFIYPNLEKRKQRDNEFMARLDELLKANITDVTYSVTRLCSDINMERSGVYKIVHRATGMSTSDYIYSRRVAYAIEAIKANPNLSDTDIAEMSGFCSANSMQMQLIKHTGRSTYDCRLMSKKNKS